jgi:glycosyltransferase involved in cell wall biosynthesis
VITIGPDLFGETREKYPEVASALIENLPLQVTFNAPTDQCVQELRNFLCNGCTGTVVYTGTLESYQRMDLLVEAAEQVVRRHPQVRFLIAGGTVQQVHHWEQIVAQERLESSVRFLGTVSVPEVLALLEIATILVSPRASGMSVPLKIYTYMSAGKPILATRIDGHTDVLTDDSAYLVAPTSTAMAEGLIRLLDDPDLRSRLGQRAKQLGSEINSAETYLNRLNVLYGNFGKPLRETSTASARVWGR